jgi:hypothetical protein
LHTLQQLALKQAEFMSFKDSTNMWIFFAHVVYD